VTRPVAHAGTRETWLSSNRRAFAAALLLPVLLAAGSGGLLLAVDPLPWRIAAGVVGVLSLLVIIPLALLAQQPRLAYHDWHLLVYLGAARPFRLPVDVVEVFFLGQAPSMVSPEGDPFDDQGPTTSTIVVRLAEKADEWQKRDVRPMLGHWCEGYITLRGTWCEPITEDLVRTLNHRLVEVKREQKSLGLGEAS